MVEGGANILALGARLSSGPVCLWLRPLASLSLGVLICITALVLRRLPLLAPGCGAACGLTIRPSASLSQVSKFRVGPDRDWQATHSGPVKGPPRTPRPFPRACVIRWPRRPERTPEDQPEAPAAGFEAWQGQLLWDPAPHLCRVPLGAGS